MRPFCLDVHSQHIKWIHSKREVIIMQYDDEVISIRDDVANFKVEQIIDINISFFLYITQYITDGCSLLDIGTGNGFVLSQV